MHDNDQIQPPKFTTIDAEPHEVRSERTRRNANAHLLMAIAGAGMLFWVWTVRQTVSAEALFAGAAMTGGFVGAGLIVWLNQWRGV